MSEQKASIGRIVHFYQEGYGPFAAIITDVHDEAGKFVNLAWFQHYPTVLMAQGSAWEKGHPNAMSGMYWEFPPRV